MTIPGFTSTGSKRPEALFGTDERGVPSRMTRASGCRCWDEQGREYLDTVMALGAVALGYGHPAVVAAVERAVRDGIVGGLSPTLEEEVAERLAAVIPGAESVRFFKTGAEAVAAAVRIARVATGRDQVVTCGYHGWLDWCVDEPGVPAAVRELRTAVPFNDPSALRSIAPREPAAIVLEPIVEDAPAVQWLATARETATQCGAVLIFDEIKTAFRIATGGAAERYGVVPDLAVVGKALGNGMPLAAVCGPRDLLSAATRTWISSTLATECASLAAAKAVIETFERESVPVHLAEVGTVLWHGLERLATAYPDVIEGIRGVPQMCFLRWQTEQLSSAVATEAAARGLLFKRTAYNFVSLAHTLEIVSMIVDRLQAALDEVRRTC